MNAYVNGENEIRVKEILSRRTARCIRPVYQVKFYLKFLNMNE
ncbi:hypothetical protein [Thermoactinomyces mirandus]|nr:hypothetical protein [Thermoactinomyces mirandus]